MIYRALLILGTILLIHTLAFGQPTTVVTHPPIAYFTSKGEPLPPQAFVRHETSYSKKAPQILANEITAMAGHFRVTFSGETNDPAGGYFHPQLGEARRNVLLAVLTDISTLIKRPHLINDTVDILALCAYRRDGTAAQATAIYADDPAGQNGILDGAVWTTLNSGVDAFKYLPQRPAYHGIIEINTANTFNLDYNATTFSGIDLYTVLLHECLHALGVATFIQSDGSSLRGGGYYTRFDTFVHTADGRSLIERTNQCYALHYNSAIPPATFQIPCSNNSPSLVFKGKFATQLPLYTPRGFSFGTSICHIDTDCGATSVMSYSIQHSIARRAPTVSDVQMVADLGYSITGSYGNPNNGGGRFATYPSTSELTAAGNDELIVRFDETKSRMFNSEDLLQNDVGVSEVRCMEVIGGDAVGRVAVASDSLKTLYGKEYIFERGPEFAGIAIIRYIGVNTITGAESNTAYFVIRVQLVRYSNCPPKEYLGLCNSGFELAAGGGAFEDFSVSNHCSSLSPLTAWENMPFTPDIYVRKGSGRINLRTNGLFPSDTIQLIRIAPIKPETWDNDPANEVMVGVMNKMVTNFPPDTSIKHFINEGLIQSFYPKNMDTIGEYVLELHAYTPTFNKYDINAARLSVNIVDYNVCARYPEYKGIIDSPPDFGGMMVLDTTFTHSLWHKLRSKPFRFRTKDFTQLILYANKLNLSDTNQEYDNYIFMDDVRLRPAGYGLDVLPVTYFPCLGEEVPFVITVCWDAAEYIRPLTLHANLPDGLELIDGDFHNENGLIITHLNDTKADSNGCFTTVLRTRVKGDTRFLNRAQKVQILPDAVPIEQAERLGKTSVSVTPSVPAMSVHKAITKVRETDSADYFSVRTVVCNSSTEPVTGVLVTDSLSSLVRIMDTSIRLNNLPLINIPPNYNTKYQKNGNLFSFRSFDLSPRFVSSTDSGSACAVLEYIVQTPPHFNLFSIPSTIKALGSICQITTSTSWGGQRLGGSTAGVPTILAIAPNPVDDHAVISIDIPVAGEYSCVVYDVLGRSIQTLIDGYIDSGRYQFTVVTSDWVCGSYCVQLRGNTATDGKLLSVWR
ncbi:MAG: hypothetical protein U0264_14025 [Candidatus Kapaibacterium sp.]